MKPCLALHASHASFSVGKVVCEALSGAAPLRVVGDRVELPAPVVIPWKAREFDSRLEWHAKDLSGADLVVLPLVAVRIPLLAAVIARVRADAVNGQRTAVVIVSSGDTRDNPGRGNSTERIAAALALLLQQTTLGEGVDVLHHHFDTPSPHRFDGLPAFLRGLLGDLARYRREVVDAHAAEWAKHFRVSLSVNTGPAPMITGFVRGTEEFASHMIVVGDARRWPEREGGAVTFEAITLDTDGFRQQPSVPIEDFAQHEVVSRAIAAMREWHAEYVSARPMRAEALVKAGATGAEAGFWFRKGTQEVLAILVVRDPRTDSLRTFRGVNLEVSLPTGTLCAERNAIGSAFAALPTLERRHIEAVAVLGLKGSARLGPCGACTEWLRKMAEANPDLRVVTFDDADCTRAFVDPVC